MKTPPSVLIVDAAILIAAVLGRSAGALTTVSKHAALISTERAVEEARRRLEFGLRRPELAPLLDLLADALEVFPVEMLDPEIADAEAALRDAVPSRNGSERDAHILTLAWETDADIWSHDRDFAGVGVASWSTMNLIRAIEQTARQT